MLEVNNLDLTIGNKCILKNINMKCEYGKIYGIVGDNGSGKTMLLRCMCGFVKPTRGFVVCDGKKIGNEVDYLPSAGIIIETPGFISYYSGFKNLKYLASLNKIADDDHIRDCMRKCGLDPSMKKVVKKYSLGMRQRLGIAQAIMEYPRILILDEPFNSLDKTGVDDIRKLILDMKNQGTMIILVSHNSYDIDSLCDSVYNL